MYVFPTLNRAEELETALMEMVKEDNRLELNARVCMFGWFIFLCDLSHFWYFIKYLCLL